MPKRHIRKLNFYMRGKPEKKTRGLRRVSDRIRKVKLPEREYEYY